MSLTLSERAVQDIPILVVAGDIDAQSLPPLEDRLQRFICEAQYRLVLDFSAVPFIASAGLGVLMSVIGDIHDNGGQMVIAACQPNVYRTFDLLDFTTLFGFAATVEEAVATFGEDL